MTAVGHSRFSKRNRGRIPSLLLLFVTLPTMLFAQEEDGRWVRITLQDECAQLLPALPSFDAHTVSSINGNIRAIIQASDTGILARNGCDWSVEIGDMTTWYRNRAATEMDDPKSVSALSTGLQDPDGFRLGSVAGSYTLEEFNAITDSMMTLFPELIRSSRIGSTAEGRPIWLFTIEAPGAPNVRPRALYTGLTHAREPLSMVNLIYSMWSLVERYGEDPEITQLLHNRTLHFVPLVNADGYAKNLRDAPQGGGMWRKNMRGVDLNRNWGPADNWSMPEDGGSDDQSSEYYRGPYPFSEPETQALRRLYDSLEIDVALHHHSAGNVLLYNHEDHFDAPSDGVWSIYSADALSRETGCAFAPSPLGVGYLASGTVTGYTAASAPAAGYSWTPESGTIEDGFWPHPSRYLPLCRAYCSMNVTLARMAGDLIRFEERVLHDDRSLTLRFRNVGSDATVGGVTVTIADVTSSTGVVPPNGSFDITLSAEQTVGLLDEARNRISGVIISDSFVDSFHVEVPGWKANLLFEDTFDDGLGRWSPDLWGVETYEGAGRVLADSPYEMTTFGSIPNVCELDEEIDLSGYEAAELIFLGRGGLQGMDYGMRVYARRGGSTTWIPLTCELFQRENTIDDTARSVLRGDHGVWREYRLALDSFIGSRVSLKFEVDTRSRFLIERSEGVYINDLRVVGARSASSVAEGPGPKSREGKVDLVILSGAEGWDRLRSTLYDESRSDGTPIRLVDLTGRIVGSWSSPYRAVELIGKLSSGHYLLYWSDLSERVIRLIIP